MIKESIKVGAVALLTFSFFIPNAHAQEITTEGNASMEITAERSSYYTVAVPETLSIGQADSVDFQVQVKGNLAPNEQLKVTVDKDVVMKRENDNSYTGTGIATLNDAVFDESNLSDSYVSQTGNIVFNETKAGTYTGTISFKVAVEKTEEPVTPEPPTVEKYQLQEGSASSMLPYKDAATSISFDRGIPDLTGKIYTDVSLNKDGTVIAYLDDENGMHIVSDGIIQFHEHCNFLFRYYQKITTIKFNNNVDTSNVQTMGSMFGNCPYLIDLDLSSFDLDNVLSIDFLLANDTNLKKVVFPEIKSNKLVNANGAFQNCNNLSTILNVKVQDINIINNFFNNSATTPDSKIIVNYTAESENLVNKLIATKSSTSNVVKGTLLE